MLDHIRPVILPLCLLAVGTAAQATQDAVPVNLTNHPATDGGFAEWSPDGTQIAFVSNRKLGGFEFDIFVMDADGSNPINLTDHPGPDAHPSWSPDGRHIVFETFRDGNPEIYMMAADGSNQVNLTRHPANDAFPAWSPDGAKIAFMSLRDGHADIHVMDADGTDPINLTDSGPVDTMPAWSPDGERIAFVSFRDRDAEIYVMRADGSDPVNVTRRALFDAEPAWSPDGSRIAFMSQRHNDREIFVMNHDGSGQVNVTNSPGTEDAEPAWSPDGTRILYQSWTIPASSDDVVNVELLVLRLVPPVTAVAAGPGAWPRVFALQPSYPNPANASTVIRFALPAAADVELAVFGLAGQRLATLVRGHRDAGSHALRWDGRDDVGHRLASGVYLLRLRTGDRVETGKLMLLR